jgi:hypothetical protein
MECPAGYEREGMVVRLKKALYGLKESPRRWFLHLKEYLESLQMVQSKLDPCMFQYEVDGRLALMVGVWVDDLLIVGEPDRVDAFTVEIKKEFLMEDLGQPKRIVGIDVEVTETAIVLHQETYAKKVLNRFKFEESSPKKTPMEVKLKLTKEETQDAEENRNFPYRSLVACLLYLSVCTRFDLCFTVKELARWLNNPGSAMIKAAKRALRYVQGSTKFGLVYRRKWRPDQLAGIFTKWSRANPIAGTVDADWAGQQDTRRSTAGFIMLFNGTALHWWSRTLKVIALSSQDAEYMALSDSSREVIFVRQLLESLGFNLNPTELYSDNNGAITLASKPGDHQRSKHIQVRFHFVRQKIEEGVATVLKIHTSEQLADVMTKALCTDQHWILCNRAAGKY